MRDAGACAVAVERVADRCGRIDILVNNAGIIRDNQLAALEDDDVRAVLETNVGGVFNMARAVVPHMIVQRAGKIINLSSVSGEKGGRGQTNYAASKGAINAFTRALAVELAPRKITVNAVAPGVIETEMSQDVRDRPFGAACRHTETRSSMQTGITTQMSRYSGHARLAETAQKRKDSRRRKSLSLRK